MSCCRPANAASHAARITDGNGRFDHHGGVRIDRQHVADHRFHRGGVEVVGFRVVIGGRGNDHEIGTGKSLALVERGFQVERLVGEEILDFGVDDRRFSPVEHIHLGGQDVEGDDFIMLGEQDSIGETDVTGPGDSDFHGLFAQNWTVFPPHPPRLNGLNTRQASRFCHPVNG